MNLIIPISSQAIVRPYNCDALEVPSACGSVCPASEVTSDSQGSIVMDSISSSEVPAAASTILPSTSTLNPTAAVLLESTTRDSDPGGTPPKQKKAICFSVLDTTNGTTLQV